MQRGDSGSNNDPKPPFSDGWRKIEAEENMEILSLRKLGST